MRVTGGRLACVMMMAEVCNAGEPAPGGKNGSRVTVRDEKKGTFFSKSDHLNRGKIVWMMFWSLKCNFLG